MNYFAYGSNMNPERMLTRGITFSSRKRASLSGYTIRFNKTSQTYPGYAAANIMPNKRTMVEGIVYGISEDDLTKIDTFEGYPDHYDRITVTITMQTEKQIDAVTYKAQPHMEQKASYPHPDYLTHILAGRDLLSTAYIAKLEQYQFHE